MKMTNKCVQKMYKPIDITGQKFNNLTVLSLHHRDAKSRTYYWLCRCDCGNEHIVSGKALKNGSVKSCGCLRKNNVKNISKQKTILYEALCSIMDYSIISSSDMSYKDKYENAYKIALDAIKKVSKE